MKNTNKNRINQPFFHDRVQAGLYEYRGWFVWKDATRNLWIIDGPKGGAFKYLKEAKEHIDWIIKYPSKKPLVKPE
jgi:hypothetical protein